MAVKVLLIVEYLAFVKDVELDSASSSKLALTFFHGRRMWPKYILSLHHHTQNCHFPAILAILPPT
jgi:hypothetical protein